MIFDRRPEFRRPRVGPYRQTRMSCAIRGLFSLVAKGVLWGEILVIFAFQIVAGGTGGDSISWTRKDWIRIVVVAATIIALILIFAYPEIEKNIMMRELAATPLPSEYSVSIDDNRAAGCWKYLIVVLVLLIGIDSSVTAAKEPRNIVYEDDYIWYLARGMADWQMGVVFPRGMPDDIDFYIRSDAALLYHRYLIACDGPLNDLASSLSGYGADYENMSKSDIFHFIGMSGRQVWPILTRWNEKIFPKLAERMAKGQASTQFPSCVNENYVVPTIEERSDQSVTSRKNESGSSGT